MEQAHVLELFERHHKRLFLTALSITMCRASAEDAVQSALARILEKTVGVRNPVAYLFAIVRNIAIDAARSARALPQDPELLASAEKSECLISPRGLNAALAMLSAEERETIVLKTYGDLRLREIAELRSESINTVAARYRRGLEKLKHELEREDD